MDTSREQGFQPKQISVPDRFRTPERAPRDYAHPSDSVLPTEHVRLAYAHIDAATGNKDGAIAQKRAFIVDIRSDRLIDEELLTRHPTVYVGSGKDIEYPLCLGSRTLMMVDPIFRDPAMRAEVKDHVSAIITHQPEWIGDGLQFKFDFGKGEEDVLITFHPDLFLAPEAYAAAQTESNEAVGIQRVAAILKEDPDDPFVTDEVKEEWRTRTGRFAPDYKPRKDSIPPRFEIPDRVGMILGHRTTGVDFDQDPAVSAALVQGGYFLSDHALESIAHSLTPQELQDLLLGRVDNRSNEIYRQKWRERGFSFIPLASQGDSDQYTFVRKIAS
ncbi:hypothetical protein HYV71_01100 [Candidatus Uhrbacteria bacterium]|nr:hypothetical protein [Candidatus Uhrbacteria bacterium]